MSLQLILFILFGTISAISSVLMITRTNALISALFLILNFAGLSGLYLTLNAQFIAVTQVIVYAGAIMVLFLFVIMLLKPEHEKYFSHQPKLKIFAFFIAFIVFIQLVFMIFVSHPSQGNNANVAASVKAGTIEEIGKQLYTNYVLPFEAAGYLLLAATIGAIVLAKKKFE
jgi:NADH-quinone oxidoreductase subunit J